MDPYKQGYEGGHYNPNNYAPGDQTYERDRYADGKIAAARDMALGNFGGNSIPKYVPYHSPYTGPKWIQQVVLFFAVPFIGSKFVNASSELTVMLLLFALMFTIYLGKPIYKLVTFIVYMRKNKLRIMDVYRFYRRKPVTNPTDSN
ncbi:MAG: hypothetical protein ACRYFR_14050 [Janthinobacterium lividum]